MRLTRLFGAVLLLLAMPAVAGAQRPATRVAPPGVMRFGAGGVGAFADARFGAALPTDSAPGNGRTPLSVPAGAVLVDSTYAPLASLQQTLNTFFEATDSAAGATFRADAETLRLRASAVRLRTEQRRVPLEVELGVLPRLSVVARGAVVRDDVRAGGLAISGGTVGVNPDRAYNLALLTELRDALGFDAQTVARSALLPLAGSPAGEALQARVRAAAGDGRELRLPDSPVAEAALAGFAAADQFSAGPFSPDSMRWSVGDSELGARVQLLDRAGAAAAGVRALAEAGVRLATGHAPGAAYLLFPVPERGLNGVFARLAADLLLGPRFELGAAAGWERLAGVTLERRIWSVLPADDGLPTSVVDTLRWEPGSRLTLAVAPTLRPVEEIGIFGQYGYVQRQGESLGGVDVGRSAQQWGAGVEYSTLRALAEGRTPVPFTASLVYRQTVAGAGGEPATRTLEARGSLYVRLWGRR